MKKLVIAASALVLSTSMAFAYSGNANPNAPGQAKAIANCQENIAKQNANGQTGDNTGSPNDSKQGNTAVTNCDKFWN